MTLFKNIIVGIVVLANSPLVGGSEVPDIKDGQTKRQLIQKSREAFKPIIDKIDIYVPKYTESVHVFTAINFIPLTIGFMNPSRNSRYFGAFSTIVPLCNTYSFTKFDEKMEALCPPKIEYDDFRAPYDRKLKSYHILFGGSIVGSVLASAGTKHPLFFYYAVLASMWQGIDLAVANDVSLKHAKENIELQKYHTVREEKEREFRKLTKHLRGDNNT